MNWGIVGYGIIAKDFEQSLNVTEGENLFAIASRSNASELREKLPGTRIYESYDDIYNDPGVDIIYVATPHNFHYKSVIRALESGKHVLCEKPMGISLAETDMMVEASRKNRRFLLEGMWTRYLPAYQKARALVEDGSVGEIKFIRSDFSVRKERDDGHRMWNPDLAGGSLFDLGVYNVALINHYFGPHPERITVDAGITDTGIDEYIAAQLSYAGGKTAQIYSGLNTLSLWEATLYGEKGWIRIEEFFRTQQIVTCIDGEIETIPVPFVSTGFYHEIIDTVQCINDGLIESPLFTHQDSLDSARLVEEILRLAKA